MHSSILAGSGPVFRFAGGLVRARVDDCVIAPAGRDARCGSCWSTTRGT